jgi:UDP-N-acetylmuramoyl-L-alanyl-D-glutamate--2,6-diaminopimelate ligase
MTFDELLKLVRSPNGPRLCDDSRLVQPGDIFVAVNGPNVDGHRFIPQALANGAKFFVCQSSSSAVMPATPSVIPAKWRLPSLTGAGIQLFSEILNLKS